MLTAATLTKISTALKIKEADLIAAIKDEKEVDVPISETLVIMEQSELATRDTNNVTEGKKEGEKDARGILVKEVAKKLNIEVKGDRIADLVNEVTTQIGKSNDEKTAALTEQVKLLTRDKETLTAKQEQAAKDLESVKFDTDLLTHFPAGRGSEIPDAKRLMLLKADITFEMGADGVRVAKKGGEIIRDPNTKSPMPVKDVVTSYFTENPYLIGNSGGGQGGRGGGNNSGGNGGKGGFSRYSEVEKDWLSKNPNGNSISPEFQTYLQTVTKDVPDFDYNS